jgi:hypothetical protein
VSKYGEPVWSLVYKAAKEIPNPFKSKDIVLKVHQTKPEIPASSLSTHVIGMAPNHPSSIYYPTLRKNHGYFTYLRNGNFRVSNLPNSPLPTQIDTVNEGTLKEDFLADNRGIILEWLRAHRESIIRGRKEYRWSDENSVDALEKRREISRKIVSSRIRNGGGLDIETVDAVTSWGGLRPIRERDSSKVLSLTKSAFESLDAGDISGAARILLEQDFFGIASVSKVLGLFDGERFCIYDSRVGNALRTLVNNGERLILAPSSRRRDLPPGDNCPKDKWADQYERLIWICEIIRDQLNSEGYPFNITDVEMALFVIGGAREP